MREPDVFALRAGETNTYSVSFDLQGESPDLFRWNAQDCSASPNTDYQLTTTTTNTLADDSLVIANLQDISSTTYCIQVRLLLQASTLVPVATQELSIVVSAATNGVVTVEQTVSDGLEVSLNDQDTLTNNFGGGITEDPPITLSVDGEGPFSFGTPIPIKTETTNEFQLLIQGVGPGTIQSTDGPQQSFTTAQILLPFSAYTDSSVTITLEIRWTFDDSGTRRKLVDGTEQNGAEQEHVAVHQIEIELVPVDASGSTGFGTQLLSIRNPSLEFAAATIGAAAVLF